MSTLITNAGKFNEIESIINQFGSNVDIFYAIACNFVPFSGNVPTPNADYDSSFLDPFRNMIFGKKITASNVLPMVKNYQWIANTIYDEYDHTVDLNDKRFFVIVNNVTEYYCFLCVDSPGTPSVDKPLKEDTAPSDEFYITNDGYHWKYLFTIDKATYNQYFTQDFVPFVEDSNVTSNSISGAIDKIKVLESNGSYNVFYANIFSSEGIIVGGNNLVYRIGSDAVSQDGFYKDSSFTLTSNTGAGQLRKIIDYLNVGNNRLLVLETPFTVTPDVTTTYEITPSVTIIGDGSGAVARALVNSSASNTVYAIEILERGSGYKEATAFISGNTGGQNNVVDMRVIISPVDGHGANVPTELLCSQLGLSVTFANTENLTIPVDGEFKQFGILKNPTYTSITITYTNILGQFLENEIVWQIKTASLQGSVSVNTSSNSIVGSNTLFTHQLSNGEDIFVSNDSFSAIKKIIGISNDVLITVDSSFLFVGSEMNISKIVNPQIPAKGVILSVNSLDMNVESSNGNFLISNNYYLIGVTSGAIGIITDVDINGVNKLYSTIDGRTQFITDTGLSLTFDTGDIISQGNVSIASASVFSFDQANGIIYVANVHGQFSIGTNIIFGSNTCVLNDIKQPDIQENSGQILYLENFRKAERSENSSEIFKVIISV